MTGTVYGTDQAITIAKAICGHILLNADLDLDESNKSSLEHLND